MRYWHTGSYQVYRSPFVGRGKYNDTGHTYFAKVKKCPKCHHPMEKSGGCQQMSCRCGTSFCWECLCLWQDHGPYLVCPRSHISITVISSYLSSYFLSVVRELALVSASLLSLGAVVWAWPALASSVLSFFSCLSPCCHCLYLSLQFWCSPCSPEDYCFF